MRVETISNSVTYVFLINGKIMVIVLRRLTFLYVLGAYKLIPSAITFYEDLNNLDDGNARRLADHPPTTKAAINSTTLLPFRHGKDDIASIGTTPSTCPCSSPLPTFDFCCPKENPSNSCRPAKSRCTNIDSNIELRLRFGRASHHAQW